MPMTRIVVAALGIALATMPAAAQGVCAEGASLAGLWRGSPLPLGVCTLNLREDGRLRNTSVCTLVQEETGMRLTFQARGRIHLNEDCSIRAFLRLELPFPDTEDLVMPARGRVWASGGTTPDTGLLVGDDEDLGWSMTMFRR